MRTDRRLALFLVLASGCNPTSTDPAPQDGGQGDACSAGFGGSCVPVGADGGTPLVDAGIDTGLGTDSGPALPATSCIGLAATCGPASSGDCCESSVVPGGAYNRSNDVSYPATVSSFRLDVYEVTVGRFRAFVEAGKGTKASPPAAGSGAHPRIAGSGWDSAFDASLPADTAALKTALVCEPTTSNNMWSDAPSGKETEPMNCLNWFDAFAFCAWDAGRMPTEAEWNYAAAGGNEQRVYPWSSPPGSTAIDSTYASYATTTVSPVGHFSPKGDGKWGQADLSGNVFEWVLDSYVSPYPTPCADCANLVPAATRVMRGGNFSDTSPTNLLNLLTATRYNPAPAGRGTHNGARCARAAP